MKLAEQIRRLFAMITIKSDIRANIRDAQRLVVLGARASKSGQLGEALNGIIEMEEKHRRETSTWVGPEAISSHQGGTFDACDLRIWLALADIAGVKAIPAKEILRLTEEEASFASGSLEIPESPAMKRLARWATRFLANQPAEPEPASQLDKAAVIERLFAACDDMPEGYMIRHIRSGSSILKSFAGLGHAGSSAPEVRLGSHLEVGPGWVRTGNRRRVDASDRRTVKSYAEGPTDLDMIFVSRPWIESSRYLEAEDPHRKHSPFAGQGAWPAEFRVFVKSGSVVGVSSYYPWAGTTTPQDARSALEAKRLTEKILDVMKAQTALPRYMDLEYSRAAAAHHGHTEHIQSAAEFPPNEIHCTLDFLETKDGLLLIEGGPGATPFGGAHPCGFAGLGGPPLIGAIPKIDGVAFRLLEGVNLMEPQTWNPADPTDRILSFEEAQILASQS